MYTGARPGTFNGPTRSASNEPDEKARGTSGRGVKLAVAVREAVKPDGVADADRVGVPVSSGLEPAERVADPDRVAVSEPVREGDAGRLPVMDPVMERVPVRDTVALAVAVKLPVMELVAVMVGVMDGVGVLVFVLVRVRVEEGVQELLLLGLAVALELVEGVGLALHTYSGRTASSGMGSPDATQPSAPTST